MDASLATSNVKRSREIARVRKQRREEIEREPKSKSNDKRVRARGREARGRNSCEHARQADSQGVRARTQAEQIEQTCSIIAASKPYKPYFWAAAWPWLVGITKLKTRLMLRSSVSNVASNVPVHYSNDLMSPRPIKLTLGRAGGRHVYQTLSRAAALRPHWFHLSPHGSRMPHPDPHPTLSTTLPLSLISLLILSVPFLPLAAWPRPHAFSRPSCKPGLPLIFMSTRWTRSPSTCSMLTPSHGIIAYRGRYRKIVCHRTPQCLHDRHSNVAAGDTSRHENSAKPCATATRHWFLDASDPAMLPPASPHSTPH